MTVRDNVGFGLKIRKRPKQEIDARVDELLGLVHLDGFARAATRTSSRADSASAWRSPGRSRCSRKVLLLDEPFGALDAKVRKELRAWLRRLHDEVHVTTHLRDARPGGGHGGRRADRGAERRARRAGGLPAELYDQPGQRRSSWSFLGPVTPVGEQLAPPARPRPSCCAPAPGALRGPRGHPRGPSRIRGAGGADARRRATPSRPRPPAPRPMRSSFHGRPVWLSTRPRAPSFRVPRGGPARWPPKKPRAA